MQGEGTKFTLSASTLNCGFRVRPDLGIFDFGVLGLASIWGAGFFGLTLNPKP